MLQLNLSYTLGKKAFLHPHDIAIVEATHSKTFTYRELFQRSLRLAALLKDAGFGKGDRISCLPVNSVEYLDLFMAAARLGAILTPMNYRLVQG